MSAPDRAPYGSPFRSFSVFVTALRGLGRRHRVGRVVVVAVMIAAVAWRVDHALDGAAATRAGWAAGTSGWITTADVMAGNIIEPGMAREVEVPPGLLPSTAITTDPTGARARTDLATGVIVLAEQLSGAGSANAARTPPGTVAIALDRTSDLFEIGDRVDVHDQVDGHRLARGALVVAVTDGDVAIAVDESAVADVVRGLGRGGVVAVLRSD